jgi:uncharacterized membrane protein
MGPDWFVLIGVVVIVIGFLLKIDAIAVVIIAAMTTSLIADVSFPDFLEGIGKAFIDNRSVSLFLLTLPMIALSERFGLKEQAVRLIKRLTSMTAPRFLMLYTVIRQLCGIFGIRISGMVQFVRPIVHPMTSAAANEQGIVSSDADEETLKAQSAVAENTGNFFGQNGFVAASGVLLIVGTLEAQGYDVSPEKIAGASLPIIVIAAIVAAINFQIVGRRLQRSSGVTRPVPSGVSDE